MVLSVAADVNEIARLGRNFPWVKPSCCPRCHHSLWWHGFVLAYFSPLVEAVHLRRLRCSFCKSVHRLKPCGYWHGFRCAAAVIERSMTHRCLSGFWLSDEPRERQRQWWRRLKRLALIVFGLVTLDAVTSFQALLARGYIPVSSSVYRGNQNTGPPPYRSVPLPIGTA